MEFKVDKVYTRAGDKGLTRLIGGDRVSKSDLQVECYGTMDELNTQIGVIRTFAFEVKEANESVYNFSEEVFQKIQNDLFDMGSVLATYRKPSEDKQITEKVVSAYTSNKTLNDERTVFLEHKIDWMNESLEPIRSFTLPGGCRLNAFAHVARTVCRRLERLIVAWGPKDERDYLVLAYINRLSDFLFVYSRWVSKQLNRPEYLWQTPLQQIKS